MTEFNYPVVAVGASAGGIEALKAFVSAIPAETKAAFVILQHLAPDHDSQLTNILARSAALPALEAEKDMPLQKGHIYVLPPDRYLRIVDHGLFTEPPTEPRGLRMPIDHFMRSLAETVGPNAIGVVLSGTGTDGSLGLRAIKGAGGLTFVQSPETALYDGMPKAAIQIGAADRIGSIEEICEGLRSHTDRTAEPEDGEFSRKQINGIITFLKARTGHDFGAYKIGTLDRRIRRRMSLLRFESVRQYNDYIRSTPNEARQLFDDLLINVTCFFRDEEVWNPLVEKVLDKFLSEEHRTPIRIWVPACSTGEEAYSLAILLEERRRALKVDVEYQIFASDLDAEAVSFGREALYPASIESDVSAERLERFFRQEASSYRLDKRIREKVVFATQNLLGDPPFSRLDLISCRNLLIYLDPSYQARLIDVFHFALKENGFLFLGTSESPGSRSDKFRSIDSKAHIWQRLPGQSLNSLQLSGGSARSEFANNGRAPRPARSRSNDLGNLVRQAILERFGPAAVAISTEGQISYYHGPIRRFIETPEGEPTSNLFELLAPPLRVRVREALRKLEAGEVPARAEGVLKLDGQDRLLKIECGRLAIENDPLILVTFEDTALPTDQPDRKRGEDDEGYIHRLENELEVVREDLQTTVEELETSNEELKASNEEAMAANEELQSTNEELETSREELQSLNEELITLNNQLEDKISEVEKATDDMRNLLTSTRLPVLFLDSNLTISGFTQSMRSVMELREGDKGRPMTELAMKVDDSQLINDCRAVLDKLEPIETQVESSDGLIYLRRIQPYRTSEERISGVVITYTEVTRQATMAKRLASRERQQSVIASISRSGLGARDEGEFLNHVCASLRVALDCDYTKILALDTERNLFELRAGAGWKPGLVGSATVESGFKSQAGYTMQQDEPVLIEDFEEEKRFDPPPLLVDHAVRSGISTTISIHGKVWGVIGIHDREPHAFTEDDLAILAAASNIVAATVMQITRERHLARERLMLELAIRSADLGVWRYDPENDHFRGDERTERMFGTDDSKSPPKLTAFLDQIAVENRDRVSEALRNTIEKGEPFDEEFMLRRENEEIWLLCRGERMQQGDETVILGIHQDVTERRQNEEQTLFMMRELDHRVKNLLSIILSIAKVTARGANDTDQFVSDFTQRLNAMARTHSLLAESRWQGAEMRSLLREELSQFGREGRIEIHGPRLAMSPSASQAMSMAIHELATNAAKYGSLHSAEGTLHIEWQLVEREDEERLAIRWEERGGQPAKEPEREGFGTTVLKRILLSQLKAEVDLDYAEEGLTALIEMPTTHIRPSQGPDIQSTDSEMEISPDILKGKRVLVLDDEWLIAEQHAEALSSAGAVIVGPFTMLKEADIAGRMEDIDLAVLDYNIDGEPSTRLIRDLNKAGIPTLMVTAYGSSLELEDDVKIEAVLNKPVSSIAIINRVAKSLQKQEELSHA
ncbi:chemotaxis protein CheB [Notoacmeibacter ruber]|uniref:Blue-light-activated histidine kinase n=1 Tax=Notoacmeibacter ruber TaxID=2670375 RepID=A0A3L7JB04_9HYPH|nr:chemotaxis protein CheB [Notoacmeibacter ruber]RLQ87928.1 GAF domain-containing protein [Notoacmeibacter ruber]